MLRGNFTCENLSRSNFFFFPLNIIVREAIYGETILQSFQFRVSDFARASLSLLFSTLFFNRLLSFKILGGTNFSEITNLRENLCVLWEVLKQLQLFLEFLWDIIYLSFKVLHLPCLALARPFGVIVQTQLLKKAKNYKICTSAN
ncbi:uncharacterized protein LOC109792490 isoform X1 [Cajanus cajan]|uniref:uncharacterized protein LOC109792490 isoform X1 n=1 Tax=Cajanus cajan TaxID=3821 RepID=UPI00098DBAC0|nr:uncharacterized protein LOC109792490 isoform X1 [Cajanus cajan]